MIFSAFVNYNIMLCIEFSSLRLKRDYFYSVSRKGFMKINRSVGSVLEFQQNEMLP